MSNSIRLMLVTDTVGGVWTYSLDLARALRKLGVEPILAVMGPSPSRDQRQEAREYRVIDTGLPLDWTADSPGAIRAAASQLARLATAEGVDLVQTNSAAFLADCDFDQPVVVVQHSCLATWWATVKSSPLPRDFGWRRDLIDCGLHRAAAVVAPSAAFAALTMRCYSLCRPVQSVHNGRTASTRPTREAQDFVFTAGRLWDEGKNVRTLDAAAARLAVPFEAAGPLSGPNDATLEFDHLLTQGRLESSAVAERLAKRPIFASAALYEPFGLSVLEAAQAGCALVLSDIGTFRELWDGCALFVDANDDAGFARAIQQLLDDPERRAKMAESARRRSLRYTPDSTAARMLQLYEQLLPRRVPEPVAAQTVRQFAGAA